MTAESAARSTRYRFVASAAGAALVVSVSIATVTPSYAASLPLSGSSVSASAGREAVNNAGLSQLRKATRVLERARNTAKAAFELSDRASQEPNQRRSERLWKQSGALFDRAAAQQRSAEQSRLAAEDAHAANESRLVEAGRSPVSSDAWLRSVFAYNEIMGEVEYLLQ